MAFLSDSFTDAENTLLHNHAPEVGGNWIEQAHGELEIGPNNFVQAVNSRGRYYNDVTPPTPDYAVDFSYLVGSGGTRNMEIYGRLQENGDGYFVYIEQNSSRWYLRKRVAGVQSDLGARWNGSISNVVAAQLHLEGNTISLLVDTGSGLVERLSYSDSDITAAGHVGMDVSARFDTDGLQPNTIEATNLGEVVNPPVSDLQDDFDDNAIDTTKWQVVEEGGGVVREANQRLELDTAGAGGYAELRSTDAYDLTGDQLFVRQPQVAPVALDDVNAPGEQFFGMSDAAGDNGVFFLVYSGELQACYWDAGALTVAWKVDYDAAAHAWLQLREDAGTVYWEVSGDGQTWNAFHSEAAPIDVTALLVSLYVLEYA